MPIPPPRAAGCRLTLAANGHDERPRDGLPGSSPDYVVGSRTPGRWHLRGAGDNSSGVAGGSSTTASAMQRPRPGITTSAQRNTAELPRRCTVRQFLRIRTREMVSPWERVLDCWANHHSIINMSRGRPVRILSGTTELAGQRGGPRPQRAAAVSNRGLKRRGMRHSVAARRIKPVRRGTRPEPSRRVDYTEATSPPLMHVRGLR
jgi:hypothetical protein